MALTKFNREPFESKIWNYLKESRHRLEAFTDLDYYLAGSDTIWSAALHKLNKMPNYQLTAICNRIDNEDNYNSYYEIFSN